MSDIFAYLNLYVDCDSYEQAKELDKYLNDHSELDAYVAEESNRVEFYLQDSEVGRHFDEFLESLWKDIFEKFGKKIQGYVREEFDGYIYRLEYTEEGNVNCAGIDWLVDLPIWAIRELQDYADKLLKE